MALYSESDYFLLITFSSFTILNSKYVFTIVQIFICILFKIIDR